jgi:hypothetical protein
MKVNSYTVRTCIIMTFLITSTLKPKQQKVRSFNAYHQPDNSQRKHLIDNTKTWMTTFFTYKRLLIQ